MSNNIREVKFAPLPVDENLIEMLEGWLERAKKGEVKALSIAAVNAQGDVQTSWIGWGAAGPLLLGAVDVLHFRMLRMNVTPEDEDD